ncbi:MAG: type II toxin-antitoxin system VapC family toxin [Candidatus Limnocylindrales bacterium]
MIVLDTTVLAYAIGDDHPLREPCRRLLEAHAAGKVAAATTVEAIQEFAHIQARRRTRYRAVELALEYAASLRLLTATPDDLDRGLRLFGDHPRMGSFDAVLAAVAIGHGAEALVSADSGFDGIPGLRWVDPATPALDALIGS